MENKKLLGFSFYINIGNFEAFLWNLNLSANHLFWRCGILVLLLDTETHKSACKQRSAFSIIIGWQVVISICILYHVVGMSMPWPLCIIIKTFYK